MLLLSHSVMSSSLRPHGLWPPWLLCPWDFPGKNTGVGCHFLFQYIYKYRYICVYIYIFVCISVSVLCVCVECHLGINQLKTFLINSEYRAEKSLVLDRVPLAWAAGVPRMEPPHSFLSASAKAGFKSVPANPHSFVCAS